MIKVRERRKRKGEKRITQKEIAKRVGIDYRTLSLIVNGRKNASFPLAVEIEIASEGQFKVEDMISEEMYVALKKFATLRGGEGDDKED